MSADFVLPPGVIAKIEEDRQRSFDQPQIGKWGKDVPDTSRQAAIAIYPTSGSKRHRLLLYVARRPYGTTCDEAESFLGMPHQTASARWNELWHDYGYIEPNGEERKTRYGAMAQAFVLTSVGREAMAEAGDLFT